MWFLPLTTFSDGIFQFLTRGLGWKSAPQGRSLHRAVVYHIHSLPCATLRFSNGSIFACNWIQFLFFTPALNHCFPPHLLYQLGVPSISFTLFYISIRLICALTVESNYKAIGHVLHFFAAPTLSPSSNTLEAKHEVVDRFVWNPNIPVEEVE